MSSDARETFYTIEYAKTGRSACARSKKVIYAGALRIGRHSPSPFHDGHIVKWYLLHAFFYQTKYGKEISGSHLLRGFDRLRPADQEKIRKIIGEEAPVAPITKTEEERENQSKFWQVRDYLNKNATLKELKSALELNGVRNTGGQDRLLNRVADGIVYGKATCATCPHQDLCQLKYIDGQYNCVAELQWGNCGYKGTAVVIHKWKRKSDLFENHQFLSNWPEDSLPRSLKKVERPVIKEYKRDPKLPLKGMKFAAAGKLPKRSHTELKNFVLRNGGNYSDTMDSDLDYLVSTFPETLTQRPKIKQAKELDTAIVTELLLDRLVDEFGFDQSPYLLAGVLPPIAYATLSSVELPKEGEVSQEKEEEQKKPQKQESQMTYKKGAVDLAASLPDGVIYKDGEACYDLMLFQTNIQTGDNKYYQLQIIDVNGQKKQFSVFRKWGRVGTDTWGCQTSEQYDLEEAVKLFQRQYEEKTGNKWENRHQFQKMPGKYIAVELDDGESNQTEEHAKPSNDNIPSFLDPRVAAVVDLIFDVNMITREMNNLNIDVRKMPLGKLSQEVIKRGYSVLKEIEQILNSDDTSKSFKLLNLSNQFYTLIPTDFGRKKVEIIDNFDTIQLKMKQLEALMDIQVASSLMKESSIVGQHPSDTNYQRLGAKLIPLSKYCREYKLIERYVTNGYDSQRLGYNITIQDVFGVSRPEEADFVENKSIRPRMLLWHGSRLCNYVGILNMGLRIAPPEAPTSGYMFGKGLYFADRIQKSAPYCCPTKENPTGLLLLSDVVVGDPYIVKKPEYIIQPPDNKNSTLVLAKTIPDPSKHEYGEDKVIIPCGVGIPSNEKDVFLEDQEYVVYTRQAQIKFLVKVKFDFLK